MGRGESLVLPGLMRFAADSRLVHLPLLCFGCSWTYQVTAEVPREFAAIVRIDLRVITGAGHRQ